MIRVHRAPAAPPALMAAEASKLPVLSGKASSAEKFLDVDFEGYEHRDVKEPLFKAQRRKCCYCEQRCALENNDVEHFRPKRRANRYPGSRDRGGYWWLAFAWDNLLFSCRQCNTKKGFKFPLARLSGVLSPPPAGPAPAPEESVVEWPLLVNPLREQGISHIEFHREMFGDRALWRPRSRNGSLRGAYTVRVLRLDREDLIEEYDYHVRRFVQPEVNPVINALGRGNKEDLWRSFHRARKNLFVPEMPFIGLAYDAARVLVPNEELARVDRRLSWPAADEVPLAPRGVR